MKIHKVIFLFRRTIFKAHFRKLCLILFLISSFNSSAQNLYLQMLNGNQTDYTFSNITKLSFTDGVLAVHKAPGNSDYFALNELRFLTFNDLQSTIGPTISGLNNEDLILFPNPAIDVLHLKLPNPEHASEIVILNLDGNQVLIKHTVLSNECDIPIGALKSGVYLCVLKNRESSQTLKFIKQ